MTTSVRQHQLRELWDGRAEQWSQTVAASPGFALLRERILDVAAVAPNDRCLDLGAGTGFVTLPLAARSMSVLAVDLSDVMLRALRDEAAHLTSSITTKTADIADLQLPPGSFDVIVSSYAMHYLLDSDKQALLARMHTWLVPGGRLVIADMMLGRSLDQHHRRVLYGKAATMLRRGPTGWWRLAKNILRIGTGRGRLHPAPSDWWTRALSDVGYEQVHYQHVFSEAGIVTGRRPVPAALLMGA